MASQTSTKQATVHQLSSEAAKRILFLTVWFPFSIYRDNQNRATSALPCLIDIMGNIEDVYMSRLACYCITCIVCNNYAMMHYLQGKTRARRSFP